MITIYKIIIPVHSVYEREDIHVQNYCWSALKELVDLNELFQIVIEDIGKVNLSISLGIPLGPRLINQPTFKEQLVFHITIDSSVIDMQPFEKKSIDISLDVFTPDFVMQVFVARQFNNEIQRLLVLSQLAKPGSLETLKGELMINNYSFSDFPALTSIQRKGLADIRQLNWPVYSNISFSEIFQWFDNSGLAFNTFDNSPLGKALKAFTYLFGQGSCGTSMELFFVLAGIETLYCNDKEGISNQIYEKTQVVLGPLTDFKKRLKQMYHFRSRLIHGDIELMPHGFGYSTTDDRDYFNELFKSTSLAAAILTATLQQMILSNRKKLTFEYILR